MRTIRRPNDSPDPGGVDPSRTRRTDKMDGLDAGLNAIPPSPQALAGNTLMDGAASQLGNMPQPDYTMNGPDDPENEDDEE